MSRRAIGRLVIQCDLQRIRFLRMRFSL